jgi:hypothetical protein
MTRKLIALLSGLLFGAALFAQTPTISTVPGCCISCNLPNVLKCKPHHASGEGMATTTSSETVQDILFGAALWGQMEPIYRINSATWTNPPVQCKSKKIFADLRKKGMIIDDSILDPQKDKTISESDLVCLTNLALSNFEPMLRVVYAQKDALDLSIGSAQGEKR